jgi:hypothetical protein
MNMPKQKNPVDDPCGDSLKSNMSQRLPISSASLRRLIPLRFMVPAVDQKSYQTLIKWI